MDKSSFAGLFIAIGGIAFGLILEGGKLAQVLQPTAAMISGVSSVPSRSIRCGCSRKRKPNSAVSSISTGSRRSGSSAPTWATE